MDEATSPSQSGTRDLVHYGKFFSAARLIRASRSLWSVSSYESVDYGHAIAWELVHSRQQMSGLSQRDPISHQQIRPQFARRDQFTWSVRRAFRAIKPAVFIISENDLWPNLIREVGTHGVPIAIFNTRMSSLERIEHRWNGWLI